MAARTITTTIRIADRKVLDAFCRRLRRAARNTARNGGVYTVHLDAPLTTDPQDSQDSQGNPRLGRLAVEVQLWPQRPEPVTGNQ